MRISIGDSFGGKNTGDRREKEEWREQEVGERRWRFGIPPSLSYFLKSSFAF